MIMIIAIRQPKHTFPAMLCVFVLKTGEAPHDQKCREANKGSFSVIWIPGLPKNICMYIYIYIYLYTCICLCTCIHIYIYTYTHTHRHTHSHKHTFEYANTYTYTYTYSYSYACA